MAGKLFYRLLDLQNGDVAESSTIWFDIHSGFSERPEARGDHLVIPQKPGMTEMVLVAHRLNIELRGFVRGFGGTDVERQQSWRAATDDLMAVLDQTLTAGELEVQGPYMGLATGVSRSLDALTVDAIGGEIQQKHSFQKWTVKLVCITDPPEWTETS